MLLFEIGFLWQQLQQSHGGVWRLQLQICRTHQAWVPGNVASRGTPWVLLKLTFTLWHHHPRVRGQCPHRDALARLTRGGTHLRVSWGMVSWKPGLRRNLWAGATVSGNCHQRSPKNPPKCPVRERISVYNELAKQWPSSHMALYWGQLPWGSGGQWVQHIGAEWGEVQHDLCPQGRCPQGGPC